MRTQSCYHLQYHILVCSSAIADHSRATAAAKGEIPITPVIGKSAYDPFSPSHDFCTTGFCRKGLTLVPSLRSYTRPWYLASSKNSICSPIPPCAFTSSSDMLMERRPKDAHLVRGRAAAAPCAACSSFFCKSKTHYITEATRLELKQRTFCFSRSAAASLCDIA